MSNESTDILDEAAVDEPTRLKEPLDKIISWVLRVTICLLLLVSSFKVFHFPVAGFVFHGLLFLILVFYILRFSRKTSKKHLDYIKLGFVFFYTIVLTLKSFIYIPEKVAMFLWGITIVLFLYFLNVQGKAYFKNENQSVRMKRLWNISRLLIFSGIFLIAIAFIFKTMHWPGANLSLMCATALLIIGILTHIRE